MMSLVIKLLIKLQVSRTSPHNSPDTVQNETENIEHVEEIPK